MEARVSLIVLGSEKGHSTTDIKALWTRACWTIWLENHKACYPGIESLKVRKFFQLPLCMRAIYIEETQIDTSWSSLTSTSKSERIQTVVPLNISLSVIYVFLYRLRKTFSRLYTTEWKVSIGSSCICPRSVHFWKYLKFAFSPQS